MKTRRKSLTIARIQMLIDMVAAQREHELQMLEDMNKNRTRWLRRGPVPQSSRRLDELDAISDWLVGQVDKRRGVRQ